MAMNSKLYEKTFDGKIPLLDSNFKKILEFYLFNCPVEGKSHRGKVFAEYQWTGQKAFGKLKRLMHQAASDSLEANYHPCKKDELEDKFKEVGKVIPIDEYCVFLKYDEKTVMQSLFFAIRNAFAHGSFDVRNYRINGKSTKIYFLSNFDNYPKAEIVLQEKTLLNWIKIVTDGYTP